TTNGGIFHSFFDHVVELVDFWKNYDTGPSAFGPVGRCVVVNKWHVVATSGSGHPSRIYTKIVLKYPHDGCGPLGTQVPVVQQNSASVRYVIGMSFDHKFKIRLVVHHFGHFAQYFFG